MARNSPIRVSHAGVLPSGPCCFSSRKTARNTPMILDLDKLSRQLDDAELLVLFLRTFPSVDEIKRLKELIPAVDTRSLRDVRQDHLAYLARRRGPKSKLGRTPAEFDGALRDLLVKYR